jgi:VanZ family protein
MAAILVLAGAIAAGSLLPQPPASIVYLSDKLEHGLAYFTLALAVSGISTPVRLRWHMLACFLLGATLEIAQALLTTQRSAEWADLAANAAGISVAWLIAARGRAGWGLRVGAWLAGRR